MSQELNAEASSSTGRPLPDRLLVRVPFLADLVAVATLKLTPGGSLRQRLIMRALNTAWAGVNRGDFEPALLAYEPDAEVFLIGAPGVGLAESYSGRGGWTDFMADIFDNFGEPTFSVRRVRDGGDRVAAELTLTAAGKVSGAQVEGLPVPSTTSLDGGRLHAKTFTGSRMGGTSRLKPLGFRSSRCAPARFL